MLGTLYVRVQAYSTHMHVTCRYMHACVWKRNLFYGSFNLQQDSVCESMCLCTCFLIALAPSSS